MNVISEQALARLSALVRAGEALSTDQVRQVLALSSQQFHRMTLQDEFPHRAHIGRKFWVNPEKLLAFCHLWNALAAALTITDVARLIHCTVPSARRMTRQSDFPRPLGEVNGKPRWDQEAVTAWHSPRADGAKLPAPVSQARAKRKTLAKGTRHAKGKGKRAEA